MPKQTTTLFNVLASPTGEASIILYGEIGGWAEVSSARVVTELLDLARTYKRIDVRINSVGGEVYEGLAIYQALRDCPADITIYIDGIAASMAAIIALCGKPLYMSPFSRLMLHNVSGGTWGNSQELRRTAEHMESLQGDLARMIAGRLGKTPEEIEATYFADGADHWITAREAKEMGLIDGIYSLEEDETPLSDSSTSEEIERYFTNRLQNQAIKQEDMALLDELRKHCPAITASMGEGEAVTTVAKLHGESAKLKEENVKLKARLGELEATERKSYLDGAIASGRISEAQRSHYEALLADAPEKTRQLIDSLPTRAKKTPRALDDIDSGGVKSKFHGKSWDQLDREGLLPAFKQEDVEGFKALFKERFGTDYQG